MDVLIFLVGLILFARFQCNVCWNFCYNGKEKEMCQDRRHIVCYKDDVKMDGTFLDEAPMTYHLMDTLLHKINAVRNQIAGGFEHDGGSKFPPAAKMRQLTWDNELEFFGIHRSNTCSMERSACTATPKHKQAGELIGTYGQDTKPIRFGIAFEHIFNDILDQGKFLKNKTVFGKEYNEDWGEYAQDLLLLANDKASRVGCGIVLCTNCTNPKGADHAFCYYLTCVFDVVNVEGCSVYEVAADGVAGAKCKEAYGKKPSGEFKNLCPNDGSIYEKLKCYGPNSTAGKSSGDGGTNGSSNAQLIAWGQWATGDIPDQVPTEKAPVSDDGFLDFGTLPLPPAPDKNWRATTDKFEPLFTDNPDMLCASLKGAEKTKETLKYCLGAPDRDHLKHIACHYPSFKSKGVAVGLYSASNYVKKFLLQLHNQMRNNIASGKEYSRRGRDVYPAAVRMREVIWDNELEWLAMWHAQHCVFGHDKCRGTKTFKWVGQNIGTTTTTKSRGLAFIAYKALTEFYNEKDRVGDPATMPLKYIKSLHLDKEGAGHFAQLSVDKVSRIGCAFAKCSNIQGRSGKPGYIMTCHYDALNMYDYALYKTGEPASECKSFYNLEKSAEYPYLCAKSTQRDPMIYWQDDDEYARGYTESDLYRSSFSIACQKFGFSGCNL